MKIDKRNLIPALVFGLFFIVVIVTALDYPLAAKRLPLAVSILGFLLTAIVIFQSLRTSDAGREDGPKGAENAGEDSHAESREGVVSAWAWIAAILGFVYLLGFQIGLPLYACFYCRMHGGKWLQSIAVGLGVAMFVYLIFVVLLKALLPLGLLFKVFA